MFKKQCECKKIKVLALLLTIINVQVLAAEEKEPEGSVEQDIVQVTELHYTVYRGDGAISSLSELLSDAMTATVTFLGESHDDPVAHHLEELILRETWEPGLSLSLEMFESDVQYVLDEYLTGMISEDHLIKSGRAWQNYASDYRPLVEFAKQHDMPVIAANAPRRYVNMVSRLGPDALLNLNVTAQQFLPPLPYAEASPAYSEKFEALMAQFAEQQVEAEEADQIESVIAESDQDAVMDVAETIEPEPQWRLNSQSLWDASMAYSIADTLQNGSSTRVVHVNGSFHSAEGLGILDHLQRYRPVTSTLVVTMIDSERFPEFNAEEMLNQGDYIIVTDASLARSYGDNSDDVDSVSDDAIVKDSEVSQGEESKTSRHGQPKEGIDS